MYRQDCARQQCHRIITFVVIALIILVVLVPAVPGSGVVAVPAAAGIVSVALAVFVAVVLDAFVLSTISASLSVNSASIFSFILAHMMYSLFSLSKTVL